MTLAVEHVFEFHNSGISGMAVIGFLFSASTLDRSIDESYQRSRAGASIPVY